MKLISAISIHLIIFTSFMAATAIAHDIYKRGPINGFVWIRLVALITAGVWYSVLDLGYVEPMQAPSSLVGRGVVLLLVSVVFYDRFRIG